MKMKPERFEEITNKVNEWMKNPEVKSGLGLVYELDGLSAYFLEPHDLLDAVDDKLRELGVDEDTIMGAGVS